MALINANVPYLMDRIADGLRALNIVQETIANAPVIEPDENGYTFQEVNLIFQGKFIQAIKEVRTRTNMGLKQAKDHCDRLTFLRPEKRPEAATQAEVLRLREEVLRLGEEVGRLRDFKIQVENALYR